MSEQPQTFIEVVWQQRKGNGSSHAVNRSVEEIKAGQDENAKIYKQFMAAKRNRQYGDGTFRC